MLDGITHFWLAGSDWLIVPVVGPLATALLTFAMSDHRTNPLRGWLSLGTAAIVVVAACVITWNVWHHGLQSHPLGNWSAPLGITLRADGLTCIMLLMSAVVGAFITAYAFGYFAKQGGHEPVSAETPVVDKTDLFWPLWMLLWSSLNGLFLSGDVFNLYVTLELLTLAAIGLIVLAGTRTAVAASLGYLLMALAGSIFYLAGVVLLYGNYGTLDITLLGQRAVDDEASKVALLLLMLGLMLKTALFPFHFWLPPAHGSAPAPVSAILSGLVVKGSFYILLRLWFDLFSPAVTETFVILPAALGVAAIFWGSLQAFLADRLKMLVAYSTVSQIGYLFLVFALVRPDSGEGFYTWSGGVLFAVSHACAKGSLFMAAGAIMHVAGHDRIRDLPAVARHMPVTFFSIAIASVSLMGLPPTGAFVAKWMLIKAAIAGGHPELAVVIVLGGLLAAAYMFRILGAAFTDPNEAGQTESSTPLPAASRLLEQTTLTLALFSLLLGLLSAPVIELLSVNSPWANPTVLEIFP